MCRNFDQMVKEWKEEGKSEGIAKGRNLGIAEGKKQGIQQEKE